MTFAQILNYVLLSVFSPSSTRRMEWKMLSRVNRERKMKGRLPVTMQQDLRVLARKHSRDMAQKDYFSHKNPKGEKVKDRLKIARITDVSAGENLAKIGGYRNCVKEAHTGLMKSACHRANILGRDYNAVGIGICRSRDGIFYFTQLFAHRELVFTRKVRRRVRMRGGLFLQGRTFAENGQVLCLLRNKANPGFKEERIFPISGRIFSFRFLVAEPGEYLVSIFFSPSGKGRFYLINEFDVKFTYWF